MRKHVPSEIPDRKLWFDSIFPFGPGPSPLPKKRVRVKPSNNGTNEKDLTKEKRTPPAVNVTGFRECWEISGKTTVHLWVNNDIIRLTRHHHHTNQRVTTRKATWGLKSKSRILDNNHSKASIANMYEEPFWTIYTKKKTTSLWPTQTQWSRASPRNMHQSSADLGDCFMWCLVNSIAWLQPSHKFRKTEKQMPSFINPQLKHSRG